MKGPIIFLAMSLMIFGSSPAHAFGLTYEPGVDRPGCDFEQLEVPDTPSSPGTVCLNACGRDPSCQAWNFDPVHFSGKHMCFLKNCRPPMQGSVAGVVGGQKLPFTMSPAEFNIDRPGFDIQNFEATDFGVCSNACGLNPSCEAWNFAYTSDGAGPGMCWLKSTSGVPQSSNNDVGGVKFHPPAE